MFSRRLVLGFPDQAAGSLVYFNGTDWVALGVGATGYVLTVTAGVPAWAPAGGGVITPANITLASCATADGSEGGAWKTVGSRQISSSDYAGAVLRFFAEGTVFGTTGTVRLYDATHSTVATSFKMTATGPTDDGAVQAAPFTPPPGTTQYLVQIKVPAGTIADSFNLTAAYIAVTPTAPRRPPQATRTRSPWALRRERASPVLLMDHGRARCRI